MSFKLMLFISGVINMCNANYLRFAKPTDLYKDTFPVVRDAKPTDMYKDTVPVIRYSKPTDMYKDTVPVVRAAKLY